MSSFHSLSTGGVSDIDLSVTTPSIEELETLAREFRVSAGGSWISPKCPPDQQHGVAIIIPYRDRWTHLSLLLTHLHPFLQRQQTSYTVFIVEQVGG